MATVSVLGTPTWNTTAGNKTVTAVPAVGDLIVVVASSSGLAGGTTAVTDDNSSGTYTQVDSDRTGFSTTGVLTVWVRNALIGSAASTVFTAAQAGSTGGGLAVFAVTGMEETGATAVRSNGGQSTGTLGTTPAPVLSNTPLDYNPIITAVSNGTNGGGTTARASYDDVAIAGYNTPPTGLDVCSLDSGETTATITWGGNSATAFASVAIELNSPEPPEPTETVVRVHSQATSPVLTRSRRAPRYELSAPTVVSIPEFFGPPKIVFAVAAQVRRISTSSVLGKPTVVDEPPPPSHYEEHPGENFAPVIYGYGAM